MSQTAVISTPGTCRRRLTAPVPREPTPTTPTRMPFFIGGVRKFRIGAEPAPVQVPFPHAQPAITPAPADIATPLRNSRLSVFIENPLLVLLRQQRRARLVEEHPAIGVELEERTRKHIGDGAFERALDGLGLAGVGAGADDGFRPENLLHRH